MAASNQASSPSGTPIASSSSTSNHNDDSNKNVDEATPGVAAVATAAATMATTTAHDTVDHNNDSSIPTYFDIQNSADYQTAKELLNQGNFEPALETIAAAIASTLELLQTHYSCKEGDNHNNNNDHAKAKTYNDNDDEDDDEDYRIRLHESLAPLHYLYGTTLLYSIEESAEDFQGMTVGDSHDVTVGEFPNAEEPVQDNANDEDDDDDEKKPSAAAVAPKENNDDDNEDEEDEEDAGNAANNITVDVAEDLQIAWENLETARHILVRLLHADQNEGQQQKSSTGDATMSLQLDLAQIHLRLGDLQRINGRYAEAIQDYETALNLRRSHQQQQGVESKSTMEEDRKLADLHYNLALTYMTASADPNAPEDKQPLDEEQKREYRNKAMQHYVSCGKAFAGHAAQLCGSSVEFLIKDCSEDDVNAAPTGGAKTVGLDTDIVDQAVASRTLSVLRTRVDALHLPSDQKDAGKVQEIMDLLREIHEAIDTAEEGEQGVQMVTEMKVQIQEAAEREATMEMGALASTTTIGFGAAGAAAAASAGTATLAAASSDGEPKVMMVVKKKRKAADEQNNDQNGSKQPRSE